MKRKQLAAAAALVAAAGLIAACAGGDKLRVSSGTVLQNATVVDTRSGKATAGVSIVIDGGRILAVTDGPVELSGSARAVDATGKFVVPGFNDMHSHAMQYANQSPTFWPLLIANGVTGIREMSGTPDTIAAARRLNADSAAGRADAPEILLATGPILVGIATPEQGVQAVRATKAMGADFVKLFQASRDATIAIFAEAKQAGLPVAGHLPGAAVSGREASDWGMRALEHYGAGYGIGLDCAGDETAIRAALVGGKGAPTPYNPNIATYRVGDAPFYQRILDTYSESKCVDLAKTFVRNDTWMVPTLIRLRTIADSGDPAFMNDPNLKYVDQARRQTWRAYGTATRRDIPTAAQATFVNYYPFQQRLTKLLKANGVRMLTGTEVNAVMVIPGFSLHQEFRELAGAGLAPLEILQMTTLNAAQFLGREATMGTVEAGKNADLVLLDANPVLDVANLDKVAGVVLKGRYLPAAALDKMKADVAAAYANSTATVSARLADDGHRD
ncbi:amidohydrolase family protein [Massilia putida]|uniref:amidohydrolase family protein n=1 Tax=Massilia putida TaxID=1141883 RepID=UPI000952A387|nr:amidohydrolase family protein [Massilia putida]